MQQDPIDDNSLFVKIFVDIVICRTYFHQILGRHMTICNPVILALLMDRKLDVWNACPAEYGGVIFCNILKIFAY